jgi:uncharacterized protein (DUF885 family)
MVAIVRIRALLALGLLAGMTACQTAGPLQQGSEHDRLYAEFHDYHEANKKLNPLGAMFEGDYRYNDRLGDYLSPVYLRQSQQLEQAYLKRLQRIDYSRLNREDRLSYDIFKYDRKMDLESYRDGYARLATLMPVTQMFSLPSLLARFGSGGSVQPFNTVKDYENWLHRMGEFPRWVDQAITNMRTGIKEGIVLPRNIVELTLPQWQTLSENVPGKSIFYGPVRDFPDSIPVAERQRLTAEYRQAIKTVIAPAYRKLHDFLAQEYLPYAKTISGLGQLPGGQAWYAYLARRSTTTNLTPKEIHEIGLRRATEIYSQMRAIKEQVGFKGDMQAFFEYMRKDSRFYYTSADALMDSYRELKARVQAQLPRIFDIEPTADFVIKPTQAYRQASAAAAEYMRPAPDGSRPGIFYVNTYDLSARPKWMRQALFLHEAEPGHHFQISIAQEQKDLPDFQRFGGPTAYFEGWALYAETLGPELGLYRDPYQLMGALTTRIWRANRLVVDTGLHAMGWTRQQAMDWMHHNSPMTDTDIKAEVDRYIAMPGQALAYMIGSMQIQAMRERARQALGDRFDLRAFHHQVLIDGAMPMQLLKRKIDDWVQEQKAVQRAGT